MRTVIHFTSIRENEIWNQIWHVTQLVALLNSAINPFLYYRTTNTKSAHLNRIIKMICCIRQQNKPIFVPLRQSGIILKDVYAIKSNIDKN